MDGQSRSASQRAAKNLISRDFLGVRWFANIDVNFPNGPHILPPQENQFLRGFCLNFRSVDVILWPSLTQRVVGNLVRLYDDSFRQPVWPGKGPRLALGLCQCGGNLRSRRRFDCPSIFVSPLGTTAAWHGNIIVSRARQFELEALEPRVLLSGNGVSGVVGGATVDPLLSNPQTAIEVTHTGSAPQGQLGYDPAAQVNGILDGAVPNDSAAATASQPSPAQNNEAAPASTPPSPTQTAN